MNNYLNDLFGLVGKVVIITGSNGQIGSTLCKAYQSAGSKVIGWDLKCDHERVDGVDYHEVNIMNRESVSSTIRKCFDTYGIVDILINNAGVSTFEPFEDRKEEFFDLVMDVNLKGTFWCIQTFVEEFDRNKQDKGAIINVGSFYGIISPDYRIYTDCDRKNSEIYGATKAGVIQMTKYFAVHLAERNIRVNAISPGGIFNPAAPQGSDFVNNYSFRCPMKRMARVNEMIGGVLYLSSEASTYTNGQNITIDGGMSCW
jgi:NAD(P)-dependent dehydrogenase (short-subunit alcohol dehydrogenase family)